MLLVCLAFGMGTAKAGDGDDVPSMSQSEGVFKHHGDGAADYLRFAPAAVMLGMKAAGVESRSSWSRMICSDAISTALMVGMVKGGKKIVGRTRPDGSDGESYPSGHTAAAFMTATMLAKEYGHISPWIAIGGYGVATATGFMRIKQNKHWASDVMTGAGIGILSTELGYLIGDMIFGDKGLSSSVDNQRVAFADRPSHIGLYTGFDIPLGSYEIADGMQVSQLTGASLGLEGAYYFSSRLGLGGEALYSSSRFKINDVTVTDADIYSYSIGVGPYVNLPLCPRWRMEGKALAEYVHLDALSLPSFSAKLPSRNTIGMTVGMSVSHISRKSLSSSFFVDYRLSPHHSITGDGHRSSIAIGGRVSFSAM